MDTNRTILHSLIEGQKTKDLYEYANNLNKLSYLSKKYYSLVEEFNFNYNKVIIDNAIEYGLANIFELGFSIFDVTHALIVLYRKGKFKLSKIEQEKLMNDCDKMSNWIINDTVTNIENEKLKHDIIHKLNYLYSTIKRLETKD